MFPKLPSSELDVMMIIWKCGQSNTREVIQQLKPRKTLQSVQTSLSRLEKKGFLSKKKINGINTYTPLVDFSEYRKQETSDFINSLYGSSPLKLLTTLINSNSISQEEYAQIIELLEGEK